MAASLHYLTVQDILWLNLQVTKKVHHFSQVKLEEATFYQYAYGESNTLLPQAARFLSGFLKMHPFEAGNESTIFIATLAFLRLNGQDVSLLDEMGAAWLQKAKSSREGARSAIAEIVQPLDEHHHEDVRTAITAIRDRFPCSVRDLSGIGRAN